jgi:hypothetical protein
MDEGHAPAGHVFICHDPDTFVQVGHLCQMLVEAGIPVWCETDGLWPGDDWRARMRRAVKEDAIVFRARFSRHSVSRTEEQAADLAPVCRHCNRLDPKRLLPTLLALG